MIAARIPEGVEGLTVSGGEPFLQKNLIAWLTAFRELRPDLRIVVLSGFSEAELNMKLIRATECLDVVVAGRFEQDKAVASNLAGSSNKRHIFVTGRVRMDFFRNLPKSEVMVTKNGLFATGMMDSRKLNGYLTEYGISLEVL